jgi:hypothetical protein
MNIETRDCNHVGLYKAVYSATNLQCPSVKGKLFQSAIFKVTSIRNETSDTLSLARHH